LWIFTGLVGAVIVSILADRTKYFEEIFKLLNAFMVLALIWFVLVRIVKFYVLIQNRTTIVADLLVQLYMNSNCSFFFPINIADGSYAGPRGSHHS